MTQKAMAEGVLVVRGHQVRQIMPAAREESAVVSKGEESLTEEQD